MEKIVDTSKEFLVLFSYVAVQIKLVDVQMAPLHHLDVFKNQSSCSFVSFFDRRVLLCHELIKKLGKCFGDCSRFASCQRSPELAFVLWRWS